MLRIGIILLVFGVLYIVKPNIYRRWFWKKTAVMQQKLSPAQYTRYMRIFGAVMAIAGIVLLILHFCQGENE